MDLTVYDQYRYFASYDRKLCMELN